MKITDKVTVIVCIYIDDTLCVGDKSAINDFKKKLREHLSTKEEGKTEEYVVWKLIKVDADTICLYQDDLINKHEKDFGDKLALMQLYLQNLSHVY